jgi:hypothetical protein
MRYLRGPRLPAVVLALLLGLGLFLPGVGHSLAHHHASQHHDAHDSALLYPGSPDTGVLGEHQGGDHPHLDLLATPSAKISLTLVAIVPVFILALPATDGDRGLTLPVLAGPPRTGRDHGPPPPSRAPPLI